MITARAYDARILWKFGVGGGNDSDYPGKLRALAAAWADRVSLGTFRARRVEGFAGLLADLMVTVLWALFPVLSAPVTPTALPASREDWPAGWSLRPVDRLTTRRTTGPPRARRLWSPAPGSSRV